MKMTALPAHAASKLLVLDQEQRQLAEEADKLQKQIAFSRRVFKHEIEDPDLDVKAMQDGFDALLAQAGKTSTRRGAAEFVHKQARRWVEQLPDDVLLETVAPKVPDHADLRGVRRRIAEAQAEVAALRAAPVVDPKIREKVEAHVAALVSAVQIRGIRAAEALVITTKDAQGWDRDLNALQVEALMRPDELAAAFLRRIEEMADAPAPVAERPARIAALEREVLELRYVEEALLTAATTQGEVVTRSTDAPPWCVLGVKVVEKPQKRAAA